MSPDSKNHKPHARKFLRQVAQGGGAVMAGAAILGSPLPAVHAAEDNTIRLALIGCGGRGTGAVGNALNTKQSGPDQAVRRWRISTKSNMERQVECTCQEKYADAGRMSRQDRQFLGFDAYKTSDRRAATWRRCHCARRGPTFARCMSNTR